MLRTLLALCLLGGTLTASASLSVTVTTRPETCGNVNGGAKAQGYGGTAPYTFDWTGPGGYTATGDTIFGLESGVYTLTVTDDLGATATANGTVDDLQDLVYGGGGSYAMAGNILGDWGGACEGQCNGYMLFVDDWSSGNGPFMYNFDVPAQFLGDDGNGHPIYGGFCLGQMVNYTMTDQSGCSGFGSFAVYGVDSTWYTQVTDVQGSCTGDNNGVINAMGAGVIAANVTLELNGVQVAAQNNVYSGTPIQFTGLAPGTYDMVSDFAYTQCSETQQVVVPDLGFTCASVDGTSWYDVNGDCVHDVGEVGIPQSVLLVDPGGYFAITHSDGSYLLNLPSGSYTLEQADPTLVPICPAPQPVPFTVSNTNFTIDLANGSTQPLDLQACLDDGSARPGFTYHLYGHVRNQSPQLSGPVTVTGTFDPALTFSYASPTPTSVVGNVITWNLGAFTSFQQQSFTVALGVPVGTALGTVLSSSFSASNTLPESTLANNTATETVTVSGSYDPNEKEVRTSSRLSDTQYFIGTDEYLDYTIRFQNTGTDTAFTVVVTDTLDAALDMSTFQQTVSSHPCSVDFLPGRIVRWTFSNILLPDSTTNEDASHGLTSFRIQLVQPVLPGIAVTNAADIFFDFNPPVRTPPVVVVTESSTAIRTDEALVPLTLFPNPAQDLLSITGLGTASQVRVLAAHGRVVAEHRVLPAHPTLDVSTLAPGVYVLQVNGSDGALRQARFVKR